MEFDASNVQALGIGISAFLITLIGAFLFIAARHDTIARRFCNVMLALIVWSWFGFLYHLTEDLELARTFRVISMMGIVAIGAAMFDFAFFSIGLKRRLRALEKSMYVLSVVVAAALIAFLALDLTGRQNLVGFLHGSPNVILAPNAGPYLWMVILYYAGAGVLSGFVGAIAARLENDHSARRRMQILFASSTLAMLLGGTRFAPWYGYDFLPFLGALAIPSFAVSTVYAIRNYKMFSTQVVAAQLFLFLLWAFTFFRVLLNDTLRSAVPDIILFLSVLILGVFLLRSVLKEVHDRQRLQEISDELQKLNQSLEDKVAERTEDLVRASAHIEGIVENLPNGLIETTEAGQITRLNRAAEVLLGVSRNKVVGKSVEDIQESSVRSVLSAKHARAASGDVLSDAVDVSIEIPHKRELQVTTTPLALSDGEKGLMRSIRDVTRERLVDRAKSEFISIAAHQLRTPVAGLRWAFNYLATPGTGELNKEQKEIVARGNSAADNMTRLVNSLLNVARISDGKFSYNFVPTDIRPLIEKTMQDLSATVASKKIKLTSDISTELPHVALDENTFSLVLENLIDNAVKYTPEGGSVSVSAGPRQGGVRIIVSDTGIGIAKEDQERIFEKFFRSKQATQMFTDGSGLGLFIAKTIVEDHGGKIALSSREGGGTQVIVDLVQTQN